MNTQTKIEPDPQTKLALALAEALPKLDGVRKNAENPAYARGGKVSKYADLGAVIDAIRPVAEHGVWYRQVLHESAEGVTVETLYIGHGAQISAGTLFMPAGKRDAQGFGSALTYARRYALQTAFGLATEDDDGNAASKAPAQEAPKQPAHSKLKTEIRGLVHEMEGVGDWETWVTFRETPDFKRLVAECEQKLPQWFHGWEDQPDGFTPLKTRIQMIEANLAESKANIFQGG